MFKYKRIVVFFIVGVLLIGSGAIYTILGTTKTNVQIETPPAADSTATANKIQQSAGKSHTERLNEQIESLISGYLDAKLADDISAMDDYVSNVDRIDEKKLLAQNQYIESYNNIKCTIKKCQKKNTYRVYVYYDIKAFDVEQMLPSLSAYYVIKENDGSYKIYFGNVEGSVQKQIEAMDKSSDIIALKNSVQKRLNELISTDEEVRALFDELKSNE